MTFGTHPMVASGYNSPPEGKNETVILTTLAQHGPLYIVLVPIPGLLYWGARIMTTLKFINQVLISV